MPSSAQSSVSHVIRSFTPEDIAFALAWGVHAPGLGGWTVLNDVEDDGSDYLLVDPPLVYGDGFVVRPNAGGVSISSALGEHRAPTVRDALLMICPLAPDALKAAEDLAQEPEPLI